LAAFVKLAATGVFYGCQNVSLALRGLNISLKRSVVSLSVLLVMKPLTSLSFVPMRLGDIMESVYL
jgi:hypothetical protein